MQVYEGKHQQQQQQQQGIFPPEKRRKKKKKRKSNQKLPIPWGSILVSALSREFLGAGNCGTYRVIFNRHVALYEIFRQLWRGINNFLGWEPWNRANWIIYQLR